MSIYQEENCWFCKRFLAHSFASISVPVYKILPKSEGSTFNTILYDHKEIIVPRCASCQTEHQKQTGQIYGSLIGFFVPLLFAFIFGIFNRSNLGYFLLMGASLGVFICFIGYLVGRIIQRKFLLPKDLLSEDKKMEYPIVENLLIDGWMHGRHPDDYNREVTLKSFFWG